MGLLKRVGNGIYWTYRKLRKFGRNLHQKYLGTEREFAHTNILPDILYLKKLYLQEIGMPLNLRKPETFDEKLQWLKIYDRNPEYTTMADKYLVKEYVSNRIGPEHVVRLLGVWDKFDDIDFDSLPEKYVLKCTHDSGGVVVCRDKQNLDMKEMRKFFSDRLSKNYYRYGREWVYKDIKPRIIAEEYLDELSSNSLYDYKIHCFNGQPQFIQCIGNRDMNTHRAFQKFYDLEWNELDWTFEEFNCFSCEVPKPYNLEAMISCAKILAKNIPYIRIDFYDLTTQFYFGEFTFYPLNGLHPYKGSWTYEKGKKIGELINLSNKRSCDEAFFDFHRYRR